MKKKVLSTLLAVCLFVGMAVPAVFAANSSSVAGESEKADAIKFKAASYEINLDDSKDMAAEVVVFETSSKMVLDPIVSWELVDNKENAFTMDSNTGTVYAIESKGTAILRATTESGKVKAETKLTALPAKTTKYATGFKFEKSTYDIPTIIAAKAGGQVINPNNEGGKLTIKVVPTPSGSVFTEGNRLTINKAISTELKKVLDALGTASATTEIEGKLNGDNNEISYTIAADEAEAAKISTSFGELKVSSTEFKVADDSAKTRTVNAATKVRFVAGKQAVGVATNPSITVEVGQTVPFTVKQTSTTANILGTVSNVEDYYKDADYNNDYAILNADGNKITGIAVGVNRIRTDVTIVDPDNATGNKVLTTYTTVKVVPAKSTTTAPETGTAKISATTASIKVGTQVTLSVKDAAKDAKITWKVDNKNVSIDPYTGSATVVRGKVAGTSKVTALVDGVEVGTCTITVAAAGTTVTPPTTTPTPNPSTGDSLLANLF